MGKKKNKDIPSPLTNYKNDIHARVFKSMLESKTWQKLTPSAKNMYVLCSVQLYDNNAKRYLKYLAEEQGIDYNHSITFVLPSSALERYGFRNTNNAYKYLKELVNAGFIDVVIRNKHRKRGNVYRFSEKWKYNEISKMQVDD